MQMTTIACCWLEGSILMTIVLDEDGCKTPAQNEQRDENFDRPGHEYLWPQRLSDREVS